MSDDRKAKQDAFYADEPWAKLATEAGFRPWTTESSAREAFRYCAESMVKRDLAEALAVPEVAALVDAAETLLNRCTDEDLVAKALMRNLRTKIAALRTIGESRNG